MPKWLLPTLSEILTLHDPTWNVQYDHFSDPDGMIGHAGLHRSVSRVTLQRVRAEREWAGAIAALTKMLHCALSGDASADNNQFSTQGNQPSTQGLVLSGPLPVLSHPELVTTISKWLLTSNPLHITNWLPFKLLPAVDQRPVQTTSTDLATNALPLLPDDPLASEQFCLVLTPGLAW